MIIHDEDPCCQHCGKVYKRSDHLKKHEQSCSANSFEDFTPSFTRIQTELYTQSIEVHPQPIETDIQSIDPTDSSPVDTDPPPVGNNQPTHYQGALLYKQKSRAVKKLMMY